MILMEKGFFYTCLCIVSLPPPPHQLSNHRCRELSHQSGATPAECRRKHSKHTNTLKHTETHLKHTDEGLDIPRHSEDVFVSRHKRMIYVTHNNDLVIWTWQEEFYIWQRFCEYFQSSPTMSLFKVNRNQNCQNGAWMLVIKYLAGAWLVEGGHWSWSSIRQGGTLSHSSTTIDGLGRYFLN